MQEMIRDNIQSAVIFEDDADWDVAIKYQMLQAARATRFVTEQPEEGSFSSPYGNDWDIIWLGHCAAGPDPDSDRRFVVTDDPTVLPPWSRAEFIRPDMDPWEEDSDDYLNYQTRIYFKSVWNSCTAAYAISLRGAEKVVFTQSMVPFNDPVDNGMGAMCSRHLLNFSCVAPFPTIVGISKPAGPSNRGSDIRGLDDDAISELGWSERLMYSTRQNIPRILTGAEDFVNVFSAVDDRPPMTREEIGGGIGHGEWLLGGVRYYDESEYQAAFDRGVAEDEERLSRLEKLLSGGGGFFDELEVDWSEEEVEEEVELAEGEIEGEADAEPGDEAEGDEEWVEEAAEEDGILMPDRELEGDGDTPDLLEAQSQ